MDIPTRVSIIEKEWMGGGGGGNDSSGGLQSVNRPFWRTCAQDSRVITADMDESESILRHEEKVLRMTRTRRRGLGNRDESEGALTRKKEPFQNGPGLGGEEQLEG